MMDHLYIVNSTQLENINSNIILFGFLLLVAFWITNIVLWIIWSNTWDSLRFRLDLMETCLSRTERDGEEVAIESRKSRKILQKLI